MINIEFKPKTWELTIEGHSEHGEKGKDIVCAAVSALFYTLGESLYHSLDIQAEPPVFKEDDGRGYLKCIPEPEYELNVTYIYATVMTGLQMVANQHPEHVKLSIIE